jgi:hypothetical protein
MSIDLKDTTFIIPVGIESEDRRLNTEITLSYLCKHLNTNIIIYECSKNSEASDIISRIDQKGSSIELIFKYSDNPIFHRTMFLNEMLDQVKTSVVVNYDIDVLLEPNVYKKCSDKIINGSDLVYPYFWGDSQRRIFYSGRDKIRESLELSSLDHLDFDHCRSEYGHCQFFSTDSYKKGGMENEEFISYAPEDQERGYRFKFLGYKVEWSDDYVYHIEHTRGINSSSSNPMMKHNNQIFSYIKSLSKEELIRYYQNVGYLKKYSL